MPGVSKEHPEGFPEDLGNEALNTCPGSLSGSPLLLLFPGLSSGNAIRTGYQVKDLAYDLNQSADHHHPNGHGRVRRYDPAVAQPQHGIKLCERPPILRRRIEK